MNFHSFAQNFRLYIRAEILVAEIKLRTQLRKLMLGIFTVAVVLLGLVFVNLGFFNALEASWGPIWTPLILGAANLVIALMAYLFATNMKPGPELAMAEDFRKMSAAAIESDLQAGQNLVGILGGSSIEGSAAKLLIPALASIIGALRRKKTQDK